MSLHSKASVMLYRAFNASHLDLLFQKNIGFSYQLHMHFVDSV